MQTIDEVPMILRREIEIKMIVPFLEAFSKEIGEEKTRKIAEDVIANLAESSGVAMGKAIGGNSPTIIKEKVVPLFEAGGALSVEYKESTPKKVSWDITKCAYADIYKRLNITKYGTLLSCQRDVYLFKGLNPNLKFTRADTIMEGAPRCDFCLEARE